MSNSTTQKIVISESFGGFGVSDAALARLRELGVEAENAYRVNALDRDDPRLVQVVEELGKDASGRYASLKVIEIPADVKWHIHEYDGAETIHEDHRSWDSSGVEEGC